MRPMRCFAVIAAALTMFATAQAARANGFGAIAYAPSTGSYGYSWNAGCRADAENFALNSCSGSDHRVVVWVENGYAALAANNKGGWGYGWSTRSRAEAEHKALDAAGGRGAGAHILCWLASGS